MKDDTIADLLDRVRQEASIEAEQTRDAQLVAERLQACYGALAPSERAEAVSTLAKWVLSSDEATRFDAVLLIGQMQIGQARPALEQLMSRLRSEPSPGSRYEISKIERVLEMLDESKLGSPSH